MLRSLGPLLGCGLMMLVCVAVMARPGARNRANDPVPPAEEVAGLREEVARLRRLDEERPRPSVEDSAP